MVYNITASLKRRFWPKFEKFIRNQFNHGSIKYMIDEKMEATDWLCKLSPGETGADWILQTICKYAARYKTCRREKDLFKIATYAFIMWLKMGYHLQDDHDEDIEK
jgi:hypothetical protein